MDYQRIILVGNATVDAETKQSKKGDVTYTTFSVAVGGVQPKPTYFPVTLFGARGKKLAQYIKKGAQVLVEGRIEVNDKGRFNVIADNVALGPRPAEQPKQAGKKSSKKSS